MGKQCWRSHKHRYAGGTKTEDHHKQPTLDPTAMPIHRRHVSISPSSVSVLCASACVAGAHSRARRGRENVLLYAHSQSRANFQTMNLFFLQPFDTTVCVVVVAVCAF
eukprot:INCI3233.3.p1 GENE.INCI3233.3~~INCI3233.3.p1  ORF type:complete len:108 (-),score=9.49 INCI3233.3:34-357(-)